MALAEARVVADIVQLLEAKAFVYVAVGDERTCPECAGFNGQIFMDEEAEAVFAYLKRDATVWHPNVHPNCRCRLVMLEEV